MKLQNIVVTRKMVYTPDGYLDYCQEYGEVPTQEGFEEWVQEFVDKDFRNNNGEEYQTTEE